MGVFSDWGWFLFLPNMRLVVIIDVLLIIIKKCLCLDVFLENCAIQFSEY